MMRFTGFGRLTRDPELKYTAGNTAVCEFTIAVKQKGGDDAYFFDCQSWAKTAEVISEYVSKGARIFVSGVIQQQKWEDKESGAKRSKVVLKVEQMDFLDSAKSDSDVQVSEKTTKVAKTKKVEELEKSPF